jgi:hypothetical protein
MTRAMWIAPGVRADDWIQLDLDRAASEDWSKARMIVRSRIRERYVEPADHLIAAESQVAPGDRRFGFAVMALDCLLVETLGAFVQGLTDTRNVSSAVFSSFLRSRALFEQDFGPAGVAEQFYVEFRCGILHQAEVGGESRVWSVGPLLEVDAARITVNRNEFHRRLSLEFDKYIYELGDPRNTELRQNCREKMNFISRA